MDGWFAFCEREREREREIVRALEKKILENRSSG